MGFVKCVASAGFVALGIVCGVRPLVLAALVLSFAGDLLLIPRRQRAFLAGIGAFLLAHVAYAAAFAARGVDATIAVVALAVFTTIAVMVHRWLAPHVPPKLRVAVSAYILTIVAMVSLAWATRGTWVVPLAATMFFVSDLAVARERFVQASPFNRLWGLPLYYAAQYLFGSGV